jgi:hypothetical protein
VPSLAPSQPTGRRCRARGRPAIDLPGELDVRQMRRAPLATDCRVRRLLPINSGDRLAKWKGAHGPLNGNRWNQ